MNDILKIDAVREFYKNSFRPNDPELTVSDILDFIDYMFMFYGKCLKHHTRWALPSLRSATV